MSNSVAEAIHKRHEYGLAASCGRSRRGFHRNGERGAANEQHDYDDIRPTQPERVKQEASYDGADNLRGVPSRPGESNGVAEVPARHHVGYERLASYVVEGARHARHAGQDEYVP